MDSKRTLKREDIFFIYLLAELVEEHALELNKPRFRRQFVGPFDSTLELLRGKKFNPFI